MKRRKRGLQSPVLSPREFDLLVAETRLVVRVLSDEYAKAHEEQGWPSGGEGLHISGSPNEFGSVINTAESGWHRDRRADCLNAADWLRQSRDAAINAIKVLQGEQVKQPQKVDPKAKISQAEFEWKLHRGRHSGNVPTCLYCREEQLRASR